MKTSKRYYFLDHDGWYVGIHKDWYGSPSRERLAAAKREARYKNTNKIMIIEGEDYTIRERHCDLWFNMEKFHPMKKTIYTFIKGKWEFTSTKQV